MSAPQVEALKAQTRDPSAVRRHILTLLPYAFLNSLMASAASLQLLGTLHRSTVGHVSAVSAEMLLSIDHMLTCLGWDCADIIGPPGGVLRRVRPCLYHQLYLRQNVPI